MLIEKRNNSVDAAKGIGILLVVVGHTIGGLINSDMSSHSGTAAFVMACIYKFHMPLFFYISGCLLKTKTLEVSACTSIKKNAATILYPYFIWSVVYLTIGLFTNKIHSTNEYIETVSNIIWQPVAHFWFLHALFLMHFIWMVFKKISSPFADKIFIFLVFIVYMFSNYEQSNNQLMALSQNFIFYLAGVIFGLNILDFFIENSRKTLVVLAPLFLLLVFNESLTSNTLLSISNGVLAVLGICLVFCIANIFRKNVILIKLGIFSMPIYLIHTMIIASVRGVLIKLSFFDFFMHLFIEVFLSIVISFIFYRVVVLCNVHWIFSINKPIGLFNEKI